MKPRLVEGPLPFVPRKCQVTHVTEGRFIDFGESSVVEPRLYVSASVIENEVAELCGLVSGEKYAQLQAQLEQIDQELYEAREELADANRELDAINFIKARGYKPTKRPGPKKQEQKATA